MIQETRKRGRLLKEGSPVIEMKKSEEKQYLIDGADAIILRSTNLEAG